MRLLLTLVIASVAVAAGAEPQAPGGSTGKPRTSACALLTKDLVDQHTPYSKESQAVLRQFQPEEEAVGTAGSMCSYMGVTFQLDPFAAPQRLEADMAKTWTPSAGLGDVSFFRDNKGEWAELYVRKGNRVITLQVDIPDGRTAAEIKPNTIALGKALLAKLG
jgi:hypothetical protein